MTGATDYRLFDADQYLETMDLVLPSAQHAIDVHTRTFEARLEVESMKLARLDDTEVTRRHVQLALDSMHEHATRAQTLPYVTLTIGSMLFGVGASAFIGILPAESGDSLSLLMTLALVIIGMAAMAYSWGGRRPLR